MVVVAGAEAGAVGEADGVLLGKVVGSLGI